MMIRVRLGLACAVDSESDCRSTGRELERHPGHITFAEIDHEIISETSYSSAISKQNCQLMVKEYAVNRS